MFMELRGILYNLGSVSYIERIKTEGYKLRLHYNEKQVDINCGSKEELEEEYRFISNIVFDRH